MFPSPQEALYNLSAQKLPQNRTSLLRSLLLDGQLLFQIRTFDNMSHKLMSVVVAIHMGSHFLFAAKNL